MDQRLKGQEVSISLINAGVVVAAIDSISELNDSVDLALIDAGYLGEFVDRFDEVLKGFSGDFAMNITRGDAVNLDTAIIQRAQRITPALVFNIVRTDFFPNGDSNIYTYSDVKWGPIGGSVPSRADFVKKKYSFKCSDRALGVNQLP